MENWLSKIDPNTVVVLVGALGGWLWAKASGKKTESLESRIESAIRQEAVKLLSDPDVATKAKPALEQAADRTLAAIGVKRTKLIDAFVAAAVERALTTLAEKLIVVHLDRAGQTLKRTADELE